MADTSPLSERPDDIQSQINPTEEPTANLLPSNNSLDQEVVTLSNSLGESSETDPTAPSKKTSLQGTTVDETNTDDVTDSKFDIKTAQKLDTSRENSPDDVFDHSKESTPEEAIHMTRTESVNSNLSITSSTEENRSPLFSALYNFDTKALEELIKNEVDVFEKGSKNRNAIHELILIYCKLHPLDKLEVKHRLVDILSTLVKAGVDVNAGDVKKLTPLHTAASYAHNGDIIKPLLAAGAKVNQVDGHLRTALHYAVEKGDEENAKALVEGGASPNAQDTKKQTALHMASMGRRNVNLVQFLLTCGAEANMQDCCGKSPLHIAAKASRSELIRELVKYGAQVNLQDYSGHTSIHLATTYDITGQSLKELLTCPVDVNIQDEVAGDTALHKAVSLRNFEALKLLTKAHAVNPNCQDILGDTPLHRACNMQEFLIWSTLLDVGGDVFLQNNNGQSAYDKALRAKNDVAIAMLRQHGKAD